MCHDEYLRINREQGIMQLCKGQSFMKTNTSFAAFKSVKRIAVAQDGFEVIKKTLWGGLYYCRKACEHCRQV